MTRVEELASQDPCEACLETAARMEAKAECYEKLMNVQGKVLVRECERLKAAAEVLAEALERIGDAVSSGQPYSQVDWKVRDALARYRGEKP